MQFDYGIFKLYSDFTISFTTECPMRNIKFKKLILYNLRNFNFYVFNETVSEYKSIFLKLASHFCCTTLNIGDYLNNKIVPNFENYNFLQNFTIYFVITFGFFSELYLNKKRDVLSVKQFFFYKVLSLFSYRFRFN